jgi:transposase InsO family protein
MIYDAFVVDAYSRRILGWRVAASTKTRLVLDALEHAAWTSSRDGGRRPIRADSSPRRRRPGQYRSIAFTERLAQAGIDLSVGSVGDAYDALAETVIGLFKTELIKPRGPWRSVEQVEIATPRVRRLVTDASTRPAATSLPLNWKPPTTVNTPPSPSRTLNRIALRTRRGIQSVACLYLVRRSVDPLAAAGHYGSSAGKPAPNAFAVTFWRPAAPTTS